MHHLAVKSIKTPLPSVSKASSCSGDQGVHEICSVVSLGSTGYPNQIPLRRRTALKIRPTVPPKEGFVGYVVLPYNHIDIATKRRPSITSN